MTRPPWCQDPTCTPESNLYISPVEPSGWCCGRTEEIMVTERLGMRHENDGHFCIRSPRGIVMLEVQEIDLEVMARVAIRGLVARKPERRFNWTWFTGRAEAGR